MFECTHAVMPEHQSAAASHSFFDCIPYDTESIRHLAFVVHTCSTINTLNRWLLSHRQVRRPARGSPTYRRLNPSCPAMKSPTTLPRSTSQQKRSKPAMSCWRLRTDQSMSHRPSTACGTCLCMTASSRSALNAAWTCTCAQGGSRISTQTYIYPDML